MEIGNNSGIAFRNERGINFMNYIEENYESIKRKLKRVHNGYKEVLFDEDVFQDTILKVNDSLKEKQFPREVHEKYFCQSFKRNLLREKLYHFNSMTDRVYDFENIDVSEEKFIESEIDFKLVVKTLNEEFGEELTEIYIDWLKGYKIKELIEKYEVKSCYYHINKMTDFIKNFLKKN
jgi:uncharacterized protein YjcR